MTTETTAEPPAERSTWYAPSVTWVLLATLGLQVGLYLSQLFGVLGKGQAVLIAVAAATVLLLSVIACLVFRLKSQFGLRALMLAVVVVAIPSGWAVRELESARRQRALVERVRRYNYLDGGPRLVPDWLQTSLGKDFFAELEGVQLDAPETDAGLAQLRGFTTLRSIHLIGTQITEDGLANLRVLTNLLYLDLSGTKITDAGIANLRELTNLETLGLNGTQVTDAGLANLRGLTNLSVLSLNGTKITDAGLVHLRELTDLETLCLLGTKITDDGLVHFRGLTKLQFLYLSGTQVTDDRVRQLQADLPECQMDR